MVSYEHKVKNIYLGEANTFPYYQYNSDTLLYCPLNEDFTDKTGNFTLTGTGPVIGEFDGKDVVHFNQNDIHTTVNFNRSTDLTVSVVFYHPSNIDDDDLVGKWLYNGPRDWFVATATSYSTVGQARRKYYTTEQNKRNMLTVIIPIGSSHPTVYLNGVSVGTNGSFTGVKTGDGPLYIGSAGNYTSQSTIKEKYISNVIIEKGAWNSTNVQERFDKCKGYYGIS